MTPPVAAHLAALRLGLTRTGLVTRAGAVTFERGQDYAAHGKVDAIAATADGISGVVRGGQSYRVIVTLLGGEITGACDCPVGEEGRFCKHQVALALAWLDEDSWLDEGEPGAEAARPTGRSRPVSMEEVRSYLLGLDPSALVSLLLAEADRDDALRQRLLTRTATAAADRGGQDHVAVRRAIDQAVGTRGYVPYAEAWDFVQEIMDAIDLIDEVRLAGDPVGAIELAEYALRRVEAAIEDVDDSDGGMGEALARLQDIHLAACEAARPDPVELATRLLDWELHDEWGAFDGAAERYRDVLGEVGLAAYRDLANTAWSSVPPIGPGGRGVADDPHYRIRRVMEGLARISGDVDALIAVMARDLSHPYSHLRLAQVCAEAARDDDALSWAEQGIADFPGRADERLRDFLIEAYRRRGRHEDAVAQAWSAFTEWSSLTRYQDLRALVLEVGGPEAGTLPAWRERAIEHIRRSVIDARAARPSHPRPSWQWGPDGSVAVQIHLAEGDTDTAWACAHELGCSRRLWLELARRREETHPTDAIAVYQREIEASIETKSNDGYTAAVEMVARVAAIMDRIGQVRERRTYVLELRARHGRKRNLIKLLDHLEARLSEDTNSG